MQTFDLLYQGIPTKHIMSQSFTKCGPEQCHDHGNCAIVNGLPVCDCMLGYRGEACEDTVNGGLSVPLTLGVLGFIVGLVILAFLFAFFRQKRKLKRRNEANNSMEALEKNGDNHHSIRP